MTTTGDIINDARGYAADSVATANIALTDAIHAINDTPQFHVTNYNYSPRSADVGYISDLTNFNINGYSVEGGLPEKPTYLSFTPTIITVRGAPVLDFSFDEIERPVFDIAPFDEIAPKTPIIEIPPDPDIIIRAAPEIKDIDLGELGEITIPEFSAEFNETAPAFNEELQSEYITEYNRSLPAMQNFVDNQMDAWATKFAPNYDANRAQLEAKIAEDMEDGTAMPDSYETALYNRARTRIERERDRAESDLDRGHEKRGFSLPPASLTAGRNKIHQASANAIGEQATELSIKVSELEIQHKQFIMQLSMGLHQHVQGMALQYAGILVTVNGQALESAKQVAAVIAQQYELQLSRYREIANVYAIEASVFKVELEASLATVEAFKARAEAAKISAEVDGLKIEAYAKELQFELAKIDVFKAKIEAIETRLQVSKLEVDIYGSKAQTYLSVVKGKEAEFNAYSSAIRGEESRVKIEVLKVDAYKAEVSASLTIAEIDKARASVLSDFNRAEAEVFKAGVSAYNALVAVEGVRMSSESAVFRAKADGYRAESDVEIAKAQIHNQGESLKLDAVKADWNVSSSENIAAGKIAVERARAIATVGVAAGNSWAGVASSALNSQNTMISESRTIQA